VVHLAFIAVIAYTIRLILSRDKMSRHEKTPLALAVLTSGGHSPLLLRFSLLDSPLVTIHSSLEVLGFILDPFKRELRPLAMLLASHRCT
jgi:hypothetical protein